MPSVALVGASGRLGHFLKLTLSGSCFSIDKEISRNDLANGDIEGNFDLLLLAVSDSAISEVAETLAQRSIRFGNAIHFSGVATSQLLWPLANHGTRTGSFHPVHSFSDPVWSASNFSGSHVAIEGSAEDMLLQLAACLEAVTFSVEPAQKAKYHAATALAANGVSALANASIRILNDALPETSNPEIAKTLVLPMMHSVIDKTYSLGRHSLTGPVARGDLATVAKHIAALAETDVELYNALSKAMLDLIETPTDRHEQIRNLLDQH